jgi:hypothetical protein
LLFSVVGVEACLRPRATKEHHGRDTVCARGEEHDWGLYIKITLFPCMKDDARKAQTTQLGANKNVLFSSIQLIHKSTVVGSRLAARKADKQSCHVADCLDSDRKQNKRTRC